MAHPRGVRRERSHCGLCGARGVNARTCPANLASLNVDISANVEQYGDQYREWVAEAHAQMMLPRKFSEMMRERMSGFNGQSTLNVGLPTPDPTPDPVEDEDDIEGVSSQNKSGRAELPSTTERLIRAIMAGVEAFIDDLQN